MYNYGKYCFWVKSRSSQIVLKGMYHCFIPVIQWSGLLILIFRQQKQF